jgi:AcrR family transcriptional regulator
MPRKFRLDAVLASVAESVLDVGSAEFDVRAVAEEFGITVPALYYYWDNQNNLINEAMLFYVTIWTEHVNRYIEHWSDTRCSPTENLADHYWHSGLERRYSGQLVRLLEAHLALTHTDYFDASKDLMNGVIEKARATAVDSVEPSIAQKRIDELATYFMERTTGIAVQATEAPVRRQRAG